MEGYLGHPWTLGGPLGKLLRRFWLLQGRDDGPADRRFRKYHEMGRR